MELEERLRELETELRTLRSRQRRWSVAAATGLSLLLFCHLAGIGQLPFLLADERPQEKQKENLEAKTLVLKGGEDASVQLSVTTYVGLDTFKHHALEFADGKGKLRARLAWTDSPRAVQQQAVTTFGIYNGVKNVIQALPVD